MPAPRPPSAFALWLEEALTGWILPVAGLALLGGAGALYAWGYLAEGPTAAVIALLVGVLAAAYVLKPALSRRTDRVARGLSAAAAAGTLFLAFFPALEVEVPGAPLVEGSLQAKGDALALPHGTPSFVRLLVQVRLPEGGTPRVGFALSGAASRIEGTLERTVSYARVGKGGRAAVPHDHSAVFIPARLGGASGLVLERRSGEATGPITVQVYRDAVPPVAHWLFALVIVALAAAAEARTRQRSPAAVAAMAVGFGVLVAGNATPVSAVGATLGGLVLGALAGATVGALLALVVKRLVPAAPGTPGAAGGAAGR